MSSLPFGLRAKVDEKLNELLAKDIIEEVLQTTQLSGCCHWLLSQRQMVTFRFAWTCAIEEVLFLKAQVKWGFHQVELDERSREITAFVTHLGL